MLFVQVNCLLWPIGMICPLIVSIAMNLTMPLLVALNFLVSNVNFSSVSSVAMFRQTVLNDCPERPSAVNDSENITTETPSGEHDGSTSIPKFKKATLFLILKIQICQSIQEINQNSSSSISRLSFPASATAEAHSDDEMEEQDKTWKIKKYRRILQDLKVQNPDVVQAESEHSAVLSDFYGQTDNRYPLFRKIRLSEYFNKHHADQKLVQDLRTRYHEPIRGLGFRRLLKKHGLQFYLIDEHKSSRCCSICRNESLHTFRRVSNPQLYRCERYPTVIFHGLLR
ncbi:hypothetical protein AB4K20DRAFT_1833092 [Rhizopus microsporus]|uniref:Uncharacterized protein n=1 Tax=Rhizopus microsporus TaxID=58291 RepID=A0A1X0RJY9_RHIZD|nr:hypothetical protein BCV71DRAFT_294909 [Rhizopus microsporus]